MAEKASAKGWTDTEKVGLFLQIIAKGGSIPWPELTLPEGRTQKACQVMLDKEKQKIKKAREAAGEDVEDLSPKKRKTTEIEGSKAKKGRKGKTAADEAGDEDEEAVPEKKAKSTKKKKAPKAKAGEDVDELVKEENADDED